LITSQIIFVDSRSKKILGVVEDFLATDYGDHSTQEKMIKNMVLGGTFQATTAVAKFLKSRKICKKYFRSIDILQ
jgi:hypothetical protein